MNLETGAPLTILRIGEGLILMPEQKHFEQLCDAIATKLEHAGITEAALQSTLPEVREKLVRRRYPELFTDEKQQSTKKKNLSRKGKK